ncbi:hypothetical protein DVA81_19405, partial [Acinetobacter baumannii]
AMNAKPLCQYVADGKRQREREREGERHNQTNAGFFLDDLRSLSCACAHKNETKTCKFVSMFAPVMFSVCVCVLCMHLCMYEY